MKKKKKTQTLTPSHQSVIVNWNKVALGGHILSRANAPAADCIALFGGLILIKLFVKIEMIACFADIYLESIIDDANRLPGELFTSVHRPTARRNTSGVISLDYTLAIAYTKAR